MFGAGEGKVTFVIFEKRGVDPVQFTKKMAETRICSGEKEETNHAMCAEGVATRIDRFLMSTPKAFQELYLMEMSNASIRKWGECYDIQEAIIGRRDHNDPIFLNCVSQGASEILSFAEAATSYSWRQLWQRYDDVIVRETN